MNNFEYNGSQIFNNNSQKIISKDIICPKCGESCKIDLNDYKICLYDCKNKHNIGYFSFDAYQNTQDISKIICDNCKSNCISKSSNHLFYKCFDCKINICRLCKINHKKEHYIINYEEKNFKCNIHKENFSSFCLNCKINLCSLCESSHIEHEITYFEKLMPNKDDIKKKLKELRQTIDVFKNNIKEIINILNKVSQNIELYFNIKNNIFQNFNYEKRNYESLSNLINITKDDYTMRDMNEIINEVNVKMKFNYILNIYKKINDLNNSNILDMNDYSYECLNDSNLMSYLYKDTNEARIQIILKNNGKSTWPINNTKLIFDESSDFKADEVILKPQKSQEQDLYEIIFKGLSKYPPNEYKSKLHFCVNGIIIGEKLNIKFIIKEKIVPELKKYKDKIKELRELFDLNNEDFPDELLLKALKENNFDYELAFTALFDF